MSKFEELLDKVKSAMKVSIDRWGTVKAAFVTSEEDFNLFSEYFKAAKSYCYETIEINKNYYRGIPDWYFMEGVGGDMDSPSTYHFETLTEKKEAFQKFVEKYPYS